MSSPLADILKITSPESTRDIRKLAMRGFAEQLGWTPSYEFEARLGPDGLAVDHLVVEHGLDYSAVISFLRAPHRASDLGPLELRSLLAISYNNLVEWHLFVSETDIRRINNLTFGGDQSAADERFAVQPSEITKILSSREVGKLRGARKLRPCDEAVLEVLARWKRLLKADYPEADNEHLSTLFNSIIFVRGCEDRRLEESSAASRVLTDELALVTGDNVNLSSTLTAALHRTGVERHLEEFVDLGKLAPFSSVDRSTAENLFRDFYTPRDAAYELNFALLSKHALSRIYERYVAMFKTEDTDGKGRQLSLLNPLPQVSTTAKTGAIFTPQFIAGFFARYLRENMTPRAFRALRSIDPACGSGIFLRTLLELQCNPMTPGTSPTSIREAFQLTEGLDRDPNAVAATRLSLSLLHLVATGDLPAPNDLAVRQADTIQEALEGTMSKAAFGAIMSNPPYIKLDHLSELDRERYQQFLGQNFSGRSDAYLAFLKWSLDAIRPDGIVCLVLPQTFLTASNATFIRQRIASELDVLCLIDLSAIDVFEGVGAYSVLLVLRRRQNPSTVGEEALVARATDFVGPLLQACLEGREISTPYYESFRTSQEFFARKEWVLLNSTLSALEARLNLLPTVDTYFKVRQGVVTGADPIFVRRIDDIPARERTAYMSFVADRDIVRFGNYSGSDLAVFYPYLDDEPLDEGTLKTDFPETYAYLKAHREALSGRRRSPSTPWWKPERPREPAVMRSPKLILPHLFLTPRFGVDLEGSVAVSRSPFLIPREGRDGNHESLLKWHLAVLNSSLVSWYVSAFAPKYARGYNRVEAGLLQRVPVPDLAEVSAVDLRRVVRLVDLLLKNGPNVEQEEEVDRIITSVYGLTAGEQDLVLGQPVD
jgi:hypothetical protein